MRPGRHLASASFKILFDRFKGRSLSHVAFRFGFFGIGRC